MLSTLNMVDQSRALLQGRFYVNSKLEGLMLEELRNSCRPGQVIMPSLSPGNRPLMSPSLSYYVLQVGGFLPGVKQIANVAALPGIVGHSVGLPDLHSGYGFAIGLSV